MEEEQLAANTNNNEEDEASVRAKSDLQHNNDDDDNTTSDDPSVYFEDVDSSCSTPFVSAPTSPDRAEQVNCGGGFFYSAPASPMHFVLCSSVSPKWTPPLSEPSVSFDFGFSARLGTTVDSASGGSMTSADELFFNGQIRPMKFSSHHQPRQPLSPLPDLDESEGDYEHGTDDASEIVGRGRDVKCHDRSLRRRARSTSPLRKSSFQWLDVEEDAEKTEITEAIEDKSNDAALGEATPSMSTSSSRSSSANRNSRKWLFLKDLLHRSKSEGSSNNGQRFWSSISFSPVKDRKASTTAAQPGATNQEKTAESTAETKKAKDQSKKSARKVVMNGVAGKSRSRVPMSAHELHYKASRAQTEEMRKKTFLPYKQGVLGCLGFSSKSYGAMNGFAARALNPVSSR